MEERMRDGAFPSENMSLTVQHLNDDSTFLLTFSPTFAPASCVRRFPGSFTILVDPWLHGASSLYHPHFQLSRHATIPSISSLADIDGIDLVLVTQDKPDHCHKETLCSLPKDTTTCVLATPAAARKIRKWKHFLRPDTIRTIRSFNSKQPERIIRIPIGAYSSASAEGEITIANISSKWDLTGVHNAIGITYCPPGTLLKTAATGLLVSLKDMPMMSTSHPRHSSDCSGSSPHEEHMPDSTTHASKASIPGSYFISSLLPMPMNPSTSGSTCPPAVSHVSKRLDNFETVLSVIYTPHGVGPATLQPYIRSHLAPLCGAFPVTALFHSLTVETNPWFLGGKVSHGAPGGVNIMKRTKARHWIGAHDEMKENSGVAVALLKTKRFDPKEVREMLREEGTQLHVLSCGEERRLEGEGWVGS